MPGTLTDKVAVVTGGSSGMGAATVDLFALEGAKVILADLQAELGEQIAARSNGAVKFLRCDVTREDDILRLMGFAAREYGGLDVLFNNAGAGGTPAPLAEMDADAWDRCMNINVRASMLGMKHACPLLKRRGGGSIVNTASIGALRPGISPAAYAVAKAALLQLVRMAAAEFASHNIRVNAICPGVIPTQIVGDSMGIPRSIFEKMQPGLSALFAEAQPLKRAGRPEDIARTALFLASDASAFTTGQEFVVDGGMMLMGPGTLGSEAPALLLPRIVDLANRVRDQSKP
jgi:NAD(P)-dependent dehydrogenase (short-subunit alcohol dehydrogenase family)